MSELAGKVAIVTGAARGTGAAIARRFAVAGATLVLGDVQQELGEKVAGEIGDAARYEPLDVTREADWERVVAATVAAHGRVDVLVNNAGGTAPTPALQQSDEGFAAAFQFNVTSAFHLSRRLVPEMLKTREQTGEPGAIVNVSSALSHLVESGFVAYGTAKAALSHMTRLLACEFAPHVRVNALAVGATETDALAPFLAHGDLREQMEALTPMARLGTVEDIAAAALYLASPAGAWVTGKVFEVDGGTVASNWPIKIPAF